ncbi:unnamed protein product [Strongylus vulgaris]|uniref:Uncharacterized protein n=1 Tax=Strongylus vulgaris TaxID=40348 RepID=A0A3P7IS73_STRVU|nr:unnamed protein product [Strongylus vulgaris]
MDYGRSSSLNEAQKLLQPIVEQKACGNSGVETITVSTTTEKEVNLTVTCMVINTILITIQMFDSDGRCILCGTARPEVRSTGVQPEVTSIFVVEEAASDTEYDAESEVVLGQSDLMMKLEKNVSEALYGQPEAEAIYAQVKSASQSPTLSQVTYTGTVSQLLHGKDVPTAHLVEVEAKQKNATNKLINRVGDFEQCVSQYDRQKSEIRFMRSTHVQTDESYALRNAVATAEVRLFYSKRNVIVKICFTNRCARNQQKSKSRRGEVKQNYRGDLQKLCILFHK